jgi:hypothetical protein
MSNRVAAIRALADGTARTASDIGVSANTLRVLADQGYLTVGTAWSSIRGGDRNTYKLTSVGLHFARKMGA